MGTWAWRGFLVVSVVAAVLHRLVPPVPARVLYDGQAWVALVVMVVGVAVHRPVHRRVWYLLIAATVLALTAQEIVTVQVYGQGHPGAQGVWPHALAVAGFVALLAAGVSLALAGSRGHRGGVLDAAVLAVACGTLVWELVIRSHMAAAGPALTAVWLVQLLCMWGVAGALLRAAVDSPGSRPMLLLFTAALGCLIVGKVGYLVSYGPVEFVERGWPSVLSFGLWGLVAAASLHPSMAQLGVDRRTTAGRLDDGHLLCLTAALLCAPVAVAVNGVLGRGTDTVLLAVASTVAVPLVMVRIRGLVHDREAAQAALVHQASHDALTGLLNRAELLRRLEQARDGVASGTSSGLSLHFVDLDGFKAVNDTLGHAAGDQLLTVVADRIRGCVRPQDAVARLGGDEFVVLCEGTDALSGDDLRRRIDAALRRPVVLDRGPASPSASIGTITCTGPAVPDVATLLGRADAAMYRAKRASREAAIPAAR